MSTRSSIAVVKADGTVQAVYCHFDGYLSGVGQELLNNYTTQEKVEALVALGDLSSVCKEVSAYHRDWKRPFRIKNYANVQVYLERVSQDIDDNGFRYLFRNGVWFVWGANVPGSRTNMKELTKAVQQ